MRGVMREPILNKISAFTADPHFRHIVGQRHSTFSLVDAIDRGYWIIFELHKGKLGEQSATLGSLFLTMIKNALFSRKSRDLFTLYCDEIQNLVAYGSGLETMLSEARKFAISIVSANQFLDQYPHGNARSDPRGRHPRVFPAFEFGRPAGCHGARRRKSTRGDSQESSAAAHGRENRGGALAAGLVPTLAEPKTDPSDLYARCRPGGRASEATSRRNSRSAKRSPAGKPRRYSMPGNNKGIILQDRDRHLLRELAVMRVIDREQAKCVAGFGSTTRANTRLLALDARRIAPQVFPRNDGGRQEGTLLFVVKRARNSSEFRTAASRRATDQTSRGFLRTAPTSDQRDLLHGEIPPNPGAGCPVRVRG